MSRDRAFEMAKWYRTLSSMRNVVPVEVKIGRRVYYGCRFTAVGHYDASMYAVQRNDRKAGEEYTEERLELIGVKPDKLRNRANYLLTHGGGEWYVSGWYDRDKPNEFHPFGRQFGLSLAEQKIDRYERFVRPRVPMIVTPQE